MSVAATVRAFLAGQDIPYVLLTHPRTGSTRESAQQAHLPDDHLAKAVVTRDTSGFCMAVIPGNAWLGLDALGRELGRDLELATEEQIAELFPDCAPGAVPPLGWLYGVETCLDTSLTSLANLYFEAGDHEHLVHVSGEAAAALFRGVRQGRFIHD
jgi:Ala-tRNA(Pro) deacylase